MHLDGDFHPSPAPHVASRRSLSFRLFSPKFLPASPPPPPPPRPAASLLPPPPPLHLRLRALPTSQSSSSRDWRIIGFRGGHPDPTRLGERLQSFGSREGALCSLAVPPPRRRASVRLCLGSEPPSPLRWPPVTNSAPFSTSTAVCCSLLAQFDRVVLWFDASG